MPPLKILLHPQNIKIGKNVNKQFLKIQIRISILSRFTNRIRGVMAQFRLDIFYCLINVQLEWKQVI